MNGLIKLCVLEAELAGYFQELPEPNRVPRIAGLVFCTPHSKLMGRESEKVLELWNYRSGQHVNFYFAGYGSDAGCPGWGFVPRHFEDCVREMETRSRWKWSGGTDLILLNTRYDAQTQTAAVDFSSGEGFVLEQYERGGAGTTGELFEQIFRYCEEHFDSNRAEKLEQGSAQHLRQTLDKQREPKLDGGPQSLVELRKQLEAACRKLSALNVAIRNTTTAAEAAAEAFRETTQPLREMYKDERLRTAKAEALRKGIPDLVVDRIVAEVLIRRFPTVSGFFTSLVASGELEKLGESGEGTSRATVGRWLRTFRRELEKNGLIEKGKGRMIGQKPSMEPYNPDFDEHQGLDKGRQNPKHEDDTPEEDADGEDGG